MATLRTSIGLRIHLSRSSEPAIKHRLMISREIFCESHAHPEARVDIYHCCRRFEHFSFALQAHVDLRAARKRVEHVDVTTLPAHIGGPRGKFCRAQQAHDLRDKNEG